MTRNNARQIAIDSVSDLIDTEYQRLISSTTINNKNTLDEGVFDELIDNLNKIGSIY